MNQIDNIMVTADEYAAAVVCSTWDKADRARQALRAAIEQALTPGEPVAWLRRSELAELAQCNYMSLGADSPSIWAPFDISVPSPEEGLVAVYTAPQPQQEPAACPS